jgi:hypothetical protein
MTLNPDEEFKLMLESFSYPPRDRERFQKHCCDLLRPVLDRTPERFAAAITEGHRRMAKCADYPTAI